jgi:S-formylglutathione hydrolase
MFVLLLPLLAAPSIAQSSTAPTGTIVAERFHSSALERSLIPAPADRAFTVYLPPSYKNSARRYPVVYLLHGAQDTYKAWTEDSQWANIPKIADKLVASEQIREMIVVMPDGDNVFGVPAYTNSVAMGDWEDYITRDLVNYVDGKYRTISRAASRGIAGHSIGAYGALKLAMKHPDIFGAVYALSACCLEWDTHWSPGSPGWDTAERFREPGDIVAARKFLETASPQDPKWPVVFVALGDVALSAAWSPNPERAPFYADFPVVQQGARHAYDDRVRAAWIANLIVPMVGQYRSNLTTLRGIAFDIGGQDWNKNLATQAHDLDRALARNGIKHEFEEYAGTHTGSIPGRMETKTLPFFSRVFE